MDHFQEIDSLLNSPEACLSNMEDRPKGMIAWLSGLISKDEHGTVSTDALQDFLERLNKDIRNTCIDLEHFQIAFLFGLSLPHDLFAQKRMAAEMVALLPILFKLAVKGTSLWGYPQLKGRIEELVATDSSFSEAFHHLYAEEVLSASFLIKLRFHQSLQSSMAFIAELEGLPKDSLDPETLSFLYFGAAFYRALLVVAHGDHAVGIPADLPLWDRGDDAYRLSLEYAKPDGPGFSLLDAVFKGATILETAESLASHINQKRLSPDGWMEKLFPDEMHEYLNSRLPSLPELAPRNGDDAEALLLGYLCYRIQNAGVDETLPAIRALLPIIGKDDHPELSHFLRYVNENSKAYKHLIESVVNKAAMHPVTELIPLDRIREYTGGSIEDYSFDLFLRYFESVVVTESADILRLAALWYRCVDLAAYNFETDTPLENDKLQELFLSRSQDDEFVADFLSIPDQLPGSDACRDDWIALFLSALLENRYGAAALHALFGQYILEENPVDGGLIARGMRLLRTGVSIQLSDHIRDLLRESIKRGRGNPYPPAAFIFLYKVLVAIGGEEGNECESPDLRPTKEDSFDLFLLRYLRAHRTLEAADFVAKAAAAGFLLQIPKSLCSDHGISSGAALSRCLLADITDGTKVRADVIPSFRETYRAFFDSDASEYNRERQLFFSSLIDAALSEPDAEYLRLYAFLELWASFPGSADPVLAQDSERQSTIIQRCSKVLAATRKIEAEGLEPELVSLRYEAAFLAARFVGATSGLWKGLKPLFLALRTSKKIWLNADLSPLKTAASVKNLAGEIFGLLYWKRDDERLRRLRQDMAIDFAELLKPLSEKARGAPQDRTANYTKDEQSRDGFDPRYKEPDPIWREAYVRALHDLGVDADGNGHFLHSILDKVAQEDPSQAICERAKQVSDELKTLRDGWAGGSHKRRLIQAYWWIRLAHMTTVRGKLDKEAALKKRVTEYR